LRLVSLLSLLLESSSASSLSSMVSSSALALGLAPVVLLLLLEIGVPRGALYVGQLLCLLSGTTRARLLLPGQFDHFPQLIDIDFTDIVGLAEDLGKVIIGGRHPGEYHHGFDEIWDCRIGFSKSTKMGHDFVYRRNGVRISGDLYVQSAFELRIDPHYSGLPILRIDCLVQGPSVLFGLVFCLNVRA
jgi:hypothetical protein